MTTEQRIDRNSNGVQEYVERKDPKDEIADLRRELEVQAATQAGALATLAATQAGATGHDRRD
jgi:hypothetical protein